VHFLPCAVLTGRTMQLRRVSHCGAADHESAVKLNCHSSDIRASLQRPMMTLLLMTLLMMTLSSVQVDARVTGVTSRRDVSSLSNHYHR